MNKQDMLKIQSCALRLDVHCDGCKHKIKKKLQNIKGVHKVSIDVDQGKVSVFGDVDPTILIDKLHKAGKHAQLWGTQKQKGPISIMNNMIPIEKSKNGGKSQNGSSKGGFQAPKPPFGSKDVSFKGKNQKKAAKHEEDDEFDDEFDENEFDEEDYVDNRPLKKAVSITKGRGGVVPQSKVQSNNATLDRHEKVNNAAKASGRINVFLKSMMGKASGNNIKKSHNKEGKHSKDGTKKSDKNGVFVLAGEGKKGAKNGKGKKGGENFEGGLKLNNKKHQGFNEINPNNHKGGGGGGGGYMGHFEAPQGVLPVAPPAGMNMGHFNGNPYEQQQYMAQMMMMMNQQRHEMRPHQPAMSYGPPHQPAMSYGPPHHVNDQYTHAFSDENTESCAVM